MLRGHIYIYLLTYKNKVLKTESFYDVILRVRPERGILGTPPWHTSRKIIFTKKHAVINYSVVTMPEDSASKKRRQRHFWSWVTGTKGISKSEVSKDFKRLNSLRSQHSESFPHLYEASKAFSVKESIKEFHRKVELD